MTDGTKAFLLILVAGAAMGILWGLYRWLFGAPPQDPDHRPDYEESLRDQD